MKIIAIEEHFRPDCYTQYMLSRKEAPRLEIIKDSGRERVLEWITAEMYTEAYLPVYERMISIDGPRLKDMDNEGITMQVLSCPSSEMEQFDASEADTQARQINDELSQIVSLYPDRFAAFATLNFSNPVGAADELERCVKHLGLKGTMITPYINGDFIGTDVEWITNPEAVSIPYSDDIQDVMEDAEKLVFTKDVSMLQGRVVQLVFRMRGAKLYAMQFVGDATAVPDDGVE